MKNKIREHVAFFNALGIFYIILGTLALLNSYLYNRFDQIYWFCYFSMFLIGIGLLKRKPSLITSQVNILAVGLIFWTIDFCYVFFNHQSLWGITDYFFTENLWLSRFVTLQHLYTLPLTIYALSILKIKRKDCWKLSCIQVVIMFLLTYIFTSVSSNINCLFTSCLSFFDSKYYYPWAWFLISFGMIFLTNAILIRLPFLKKD